MISLNRLIGIAALGLWACTGMVYVYTKEVSKKILNSSLTQEALEILRQHEGAVNYLGEPIKEVNASFMDSTSKIKANVMGPKSMGTLFFTVAPDDNQVMRLDTIQLQVGKDDSRRLIIKSYSNNQE